MGLVHSTRKKYKALLKRYSSLLNAHFQAVEEFEKMKLLLCQENLDSSVNMQSSTRVNNLDTKGIPEIREKGMGEVDKRTIVQDISVRLHLLAHVKIVEYAIRRFCRCMEQKILSEVPSLFIQSLSKSIPHAPLLAILQLITASTFFEDFEFCSFFKKQAHVSSKYNADYFRNRYESLKGKDAIVLYKTDLNCHQFCKNRIRLFVNDLMSKSLSIELIRGMFTCSVLSELFITLAKEVWVLHCCFHIYHPQIEMIKVDDCIVMDDSTPSSLPPKYSDVHSTTVMMMPGFRIKDKKISITKPVVYVHQFASELRK